MGWVADIFGHADAMASSLRPGPRSRSAPCRRPATGQPPENLIAGMLVVVPAVLLSGVVLLAGARHLPREMALMLAKLKARPASRRKPRLDPPAKTGSTS